MYAFPSIMSDHLLVSMYICPPTLYVHILVIVGSTKALLASFFPLDGLFCMPKMCLGGATQTHLGAAAHIHDFGSCLHVLGLEWIPSVHYKPKMYIIWVQRVYGHHPSSVFLGEKDELWRRVDKGGKKKPLQVLLAITSMCTYNVGRGQGDVY
jgi:hypothetical protein